MAQRIPTSISREDWRAWASETSLSEWVDGEVTEFMPPKRIHQLLVRLLVQVMGWIAEHRALGEVIPSPFEMRLPRSSREPDLIFVAAANLDRLGEGWLDGPADLVVEIISEDSVRRDRVAKFAEFESVGVPEYWIFDPREGRGMLDAYALGADGRFAPIPPDADGLVSSAVLPGFRFDPAWLRQRPLPTPRAVLAQIAPDLLSPPDR